MGLFRRVARARLAGRVIRRLRRAGIAGARYHSASFTVRFQKPGDTEPSLLRLDEVPRKRVPQFVDGFLRAPGLPATWAEARPLLRPVLRGATTTGDAPLCRPALPFLAEFVVVDAPDTMTYVNTTHGWGVTDDEVFAAARANLSGAKLLGAAEEPVVVQFVDDGDSYWTSHLLLDGWLAALAGQVGGPPVAFAPERGILLVTAAGGGHLPELFARAEAAYLTSPRAISPMAYAADESGRTVPYADDAHAVRIRRARAVLASAEYARQAANLSRAGEILITEDGRTRALWPADEPTLLPEAEEVQLGGSDRVLPWAEILPGLTAQGLNPERWLAQGWPEG